MFKKHAQKFLHDLNSKNIIIHLYAQIVTAHPATFLLTMYNFIAIPPTHSTMKFIPKFTVTHVVTKRAMAIYAA